MKNAEWIWLPDDKYPANTHSRITALRDDGLPYYHYTVARFKKEYRFEKKLSYVNFTVSAESFFILYDGEKQIAAGPPPRAGDFYRFYEPKEKLYASTFTYRTDSCVLNLSALVRMCPVNNFEFSSGRGGFILSAEAVFEDGTVTHIKTDESWLVSLDRRFCERDFYDGRIKADSFVTAEAVTNMQSPEATDIPQLEERSVSSEECSFILRPHEKLERDADFPMIYAGYLELASDGEGEVYLDVECRELDEAGVHEHAVLSHSDCYRSFRLLSVGELHITARNLSDTPMRISVSLVATSYPIGNAADFSCSDDELCGVMKMCTHTLKYCRQMLHLDSPKHCEPLSCTGDYYIETLMSAALDGDMRLAKLDIRRTAQLLRENGGRIFHTTYSLIWVRWLLDVYMHTGDVTLLDDCRDALLLLLERFDGYVGENGLLEHAPDYMFADWIYIDGFSMHHPPKALGQSCLCMYYFGALGDAQKIFSVLGDTKRAATFAERRESMRMAINGLLFDNRRKLYRAGLNTPNSERICGEENLPPNTNREYFIKQPNILAAYFGVCDDETCRGIIDRIMSDECEGAYQPYFAHFLLDAVFRTGLREKYTLQILEKWKKPCNECKKGLAEGFIPPQPDYSFDHSHAWGGSVLYSLPKALAGLEIISAGTKCISLSPTLLGLEHADFGIPTPYGMLKFKLKRGHVPRISAPRGIHIELKCDAVLERY